MINNDLVVKFEKKQHELPKEGPHHAKVEQIEILGPNEQYGIVERVRIIFVLDALDSQGRRFKAYSKPLNADTFSPKSDLRKACNDIMGHEVGNDFDLKTMIDKEVDLVLKNNEGKDGFTYSNVIAILRAKSKEEQASEKRVANVITTDCNAATAKPVARRSLHGRQSPSTP